MKYFLNWFNDLSYQFRKSIMMSIFIIGIISTVMTIIGISLNDWMKNRWYSLLIVIVAFIVIVLLFYYGIGFLYKESISFKIKSTQIYIKRGNIFSVDGWKIIGCDTHFDTRVDDVVVSKKSLHGQLFLEHGKIEEIKNAVKNEARRLHLSAGDKGQYNFPVGTIIRYDSSVDKQTYLMLAMAELDDNYKARTNMVRFEQMLMNMWSEIDRVYASHDIVLPLLGTGILRFDDGPKNIRALLKCLLCTLNNSGITFNSTVTIVIPDQIKDLPLYEYKHMFQSLK